MFQHSNAFPRVAVGLLPRLPAFSTIRRRPSPTLSRRELKRLIADMID